MTQRTTIHRLQVATELQQFIDTQVLPGTGVDSAAFWAGYAGGAARTRDMWGSANSQETVGVAPAMFHEFCFPYYRDICAPMGLLYYGCCEPLHNKLEILASIPRLRKISMSPWVDVDKAAPWLGGRYVFSCKPSPAVLATDTWNPDEARRQLRAVLEKTRRNACVVEIIMKDNHSLANRPENAVTWCQIVKEEVERLRV